MNRNERRSLGRAMRRTGKGAIVLHGGPMNGWLVKLDAPCLKPDWRALYLEAIAEQIYREDKPDSRLRPWMKPKWDKVDEELKAAYRQQAAALHGAGYYQTDSTGTEAKWVVQ